MKSRFDCSSRGSLLIAAVSMENKIVARKRSCLDNDLMVQTKVLRPKQWGFLEDESPVKSTSSSPCSEAYEDDSASNAFSVSPLFEASIYVCSCIMYRSLWKFGTSEVGRMKGSCEVTDSRYEVQTKRAKHTPHSEQHTAQLTTHFLQHTAQEEEISLFFSLLLSTFLVNLLNKLLNK